MTTDPTPDKLRSAGPDNQDLEPAPRRLFWPVKRLWWAIEKHILWPIADSFRRLRSVLSYRSPLAYIGATAMVCLTAGAVATAVYFYNEAKSPDSPAVIADTSLGEDIVLEPVSPLPTTPVDPQQAASEDTLQGVVPNFRAPKKGGERLPETAVRPAGAPDSPPLAVAHEFARTFVGYELGERKAARQLRQSATPKLARELSDNPPRLPSNGRVPKATVLNVVAGKKSGDSLEVSVSLMRSGATSELRLALVRGKDKGWLVSQVRG
ncbi:MAG: hypothetical protein WD181_05320 [Solirubrobacterales bacterium]